MAQIRNVIVKMEPLLKPYISSLGKLKLNVSTIACLSLLFIGASLSKPHINCDNSLHAWNNGIDIGPTLNLHVLQCLHLICGCRAV